MFNLSHSIITLVIVLIFEQFGLGLIGAVLASSFFVGREHAQAEYKWIGQYGNGKRANMKWWNVFEVRVWDFHSWFWNLLAPITIAFAFVFWRHL